MNNTDKQNVIAELEVMLKEAKLKHTQAHEEAVYHFGIVNFLEKEINARKETLKKEKENEQYNVKVSKEAESPDWLKEVTEDPEKMPQIKKPYRL